jgi:hypothetical protein
MYLIIAKHLSIILTQRVFNPESSSGLKNVLNAKAFYSATGKMY